MDKYTHLKNGVAEICDTTTLVDEVSGMVSDWFEVNTEIGLHANAYSATGWTLKDILEIKGWYVVPAIIEEAINEYLGALIVETAPTFGIDVSKRDRRHARKMSEAMAAADKAIAEAIPLIIEKLRAVHGDPEFVDLQAAKKLIERRNAALEAFDATTH